MTADNHLHIDQFEEFYYDTLAVLDIVTEAGVTNAVYSSTASGKDDSRCLGVEDLARLEQMLL